MNNEEWFNIDGQPLFEISSFGRVRSYKGVGRKPQKRNIPRIINLCKDGRGYYNFTVRENGKPKVLLVHIELAKSAIPNPSNYKLVRHLNDIKTDNNLLNLKWGTKSDNMQDAIKNNKSPRKNDLSNGVILFMYNSVHSACSVARRYGVSPSMVTKIRTGRSYGWLTKHNFDKKKNNEK